MADDAKKAAADKAARDYFTGRRAQLLGDAGLAIGEEVNRSYNKYPHPIGSAHEGWALLREEGEELLEAVNGSFWAAVRTDDFEACRREAIQVGAMAFRFLMDLQRGVEANDARRAERVAHPADDAAAQWQADTKANLERLIAAEDVANVGAGSFKSGYAARMRTIAKCSSGHVGDDLRGGPCGLCGKSCDDPPGPTPLAAKLAEAVGLGIACDSGETFIVYSMTKPTAAGGTVTTRAIKCLRCGLTSHNQNDVQEKYCGKCNLFHERR